MPEIMEVLREAAKENNDEKNELYYTQKQKRVLKTIAKNPHATANEIADMAEVHPSYIPYICERVDQGVVENLHRLEEYLTEREGMGDMEEGESTKQSKEEEDILETFGAKPTVDDRNRVSQEETEFTFTKEVPVEISVKFPNGQGFTQFMERLDDKDGEDGDEDERVLTAD